MSSLEPRSLHDAFDREVAGITMERLTARTH